MRIPRTLKIATVAALGLSAATSDLAWGARTQGYGQAFRFRHRRYHLDFVTVERGLKGGETIASLEMSVMARWVRRMVAASDDQQIESRQFSSR